MKARHWLLLGAGLLTMGLAYLVIPTRDALARVEIQMLKDPMAVSGWTSTSLCLADGRILAVPGVTDLPISSTALSELTSRGVEVGKDGRLYVLTRTYSSCGLDPVKMRLLRTDLGMLLTYLRVGTPVNRVKYPQMLRDDAPCDLAEHGMDISSYQNFGAWCSLESAYAH